MRTHRIPARGPRGQRGIALVVVLLLLLIVTLIGLAAMRGTLLQERMAGNTIARGNAFQLAEAILREAESITSGGPVMPTTATCTNGLCGNPGTASDGFWSDTSNFRTSTLQGDNMEAGFVIEDMGLGPSLSDSCTTSIDLSSSGCSSTVHHYRITSRVHMDSGTEVLLQSNYEVQ